MPRPKKVVEPVVTEAPKPKRGRPPKMVADVVVVKKRRTTGLRADAVKTDHGNEYMHEKANRFARALEKEYKNSTKAEILRRKVNEINAIIEIKSETLLESML